MRSPFAGETVPLPVPVVEREKGKTWAKVAMQVMLPVRRMFTIGAVFVQMGGPLHPTNVKPEFGVALMGKTTFTGC
jgi:hypothetical protein